MKVGVGKAVIPYTAEMLPNFRESYTSLHDDSYVQVLYLEAGEQAALVACGVVIVNNREEIAKKVAAVLEMKPENVVVHAKHVLSTPHADRGHTAENLKVHAARMGGTLTDEDARQFVRKNHLLCDALLHAAEKAAMDAKSCVCPAEIGVGTGFSEINVNRLIHTRDGWWQGHNPCGETDHTLPVLRFNRKNGEPLAILFNCNVAPGCLENSFLSDGTRPISGDIAAAAERFIDAWFDYKSVSLYTTGATGDQWTSLRALHDVLLPDGTQQITDLHEAGFALVEILGTRLGEAVAKIAETIETADLPDGLSLHRCSFLYPGQRVTQGEEMGPGADCRYLPHGEKELGIDILCLGGVAIVLCGVEIGVKTYREIKARSPFPHTVLVEFAHPTGGGYLMEMDFYEKNTYQARKSHYFAGTAERFREDVIQALQNIWKEQDK